MKEKNSQSKTGSKKIVKKKNSSSKNVITPKSKEKVIDSKNYLYALIIFIGSIFAVWYLFTLYNVNKEEQLMTSYLISSKTISSSIDNLDSLTQIMQESPSSYFIYLGYTKDEDVYNLEKDLKKVIDKYKLNDIFYYVDLTELKEKNDDYLKEIKKVLNINDLKQIPAIIYVSEGAISDENVLDGVGSTKFKVADLEQLLDIYEFEAIK